MLNQYISLSIIFFAVIIDASLTKLISTVSEQIDVSSNSLINKDHKSTTKYINFYSSKQVRKSPNVKVERRMLTQEKINSYPKKRRNSGRSMVGSQNTYEESKIVKGKSHKYTRQHF